MPKGKDDGLKIKGEVEGVKEPTRFPPDVEAIQSGLEFLKLNSGG